jgi:hypothetical protein
VLKSRLKTLVVELRPICAWLTECAATQSDVVLAGCTRALSLNINIKRLHQQKFENLMLSPASVVPSSNNGKYRRRRPPLLLIIVDDVSRSIHHRRPLIMPVRAAPSWKKKKKKKKTTNEIENLTLFLLANAPKFSN